MAARAVRRPSEWAWPLLAGALLALAAAAYPQRLHGAGLLLTPIAIGAAVLALRRLWTLHPAPTMCAAIALSVFSGQWREIGLGGLPLDRLLILIVVAQFLLRAPGVANTPPLKLRNVHLLLGLTVIYVLGSAAAAGTLGSETGILSLLDQMGAIPFLMFLVAPAVFAGERERELLLRTLVGLGAYLGAVAIFESLGPHALVFPRYILNVDSAISEEVSRRRPVSRGDRDGLCDLCLRSRSRDGEHQMARAGALSGRRRRDAEPVRLHADARARRVDRRAPGLGPHGSGDARRTASAGARGADRRGDTDHSASGLAEPRA